MRERTAIVILGILAVVSGQLSGCSSAGPAAQPAITSHPVQRERIEWCDIWVTNADSGDRPRVLLIGDSITRGYFTAVEKHLAGQANCARMTSSKCIGDPGLFPEIQLLLSQYRFAVIHVNNGLHGWSYTDEQYGRAFAPFMNALMKQSHGARVIWAQTTPVMIDGHPDNERIERIKVRNAIASDFAKQNGIPVDDLFALVVDHPEYFSKDGVHFNQAGIDAQARQVADSIRTVLEETGHR